MKLRTYIDIFIIILFLLGAGYIAKTYLGEESTKPPANREQIKLQNKQSTIDLTKIKKRTQETSANNSRDEWYPQSLSNRWKYITIYQSDLLSGNNQTLAHKYPSKITPKESGFHFVITNGFGGPDGEVTTTAEWKAQLDSTLITDTETARISISICLIGDFAAQAPTKKQLSSLKALLNYLLEATTIKSFNIGYYRPHESKTSTPPPFLLLDTIIKTRTSK